MPSSWLILWHFSNTPRRCWQKCKHLGLNNWLAGLASGMRWSRILYRSNCAEWGTQIINNWLAGLASGLRWSCILYRSNCAEWGTQIINNFFLAQQPPVGQGLLVHKVFRSHTTTNHRRWNSSGRVISLTQRSLPDNKQHTQHTDIHAPGGIRTHYLSRRAAADLSLRPRCYWDRQIIVDMRV
jgi:hypothetical protein